MDQSKGWNLYKRIDTECPHHSKQVIRNRISEVAATSVTSPDLPPPSLTRRITFISLQAKEPRKHPLCSPSCACSSGRCTQELSSPSSTCLARDWPTLTLMEKLERRCTSLQPQRHLVPWNRPPQLFWCPRNYTPLLFTYLSSGKNPLRKLAGNSCQKSHLCACKCCVCTHRKFLCVILVSH